MDLSTLWCYKLWKVIHTEISVTISVRGVLRWRNAALLGSRVNFKLTIFLSYLPLFGSEFANFAFQVREWTCQDTLWGKSAALGLFRCKFDSLLVSLYWSPKAFRIFIASVYFLYYIYIWNILSLSHSYACDEFVINDTRSGDIQRVREIMLERENRWDNLGLHG